MLGALESPQHWLTCKAHREFRDGVDPELVRKDRVQYIRKVISKRKVLENQLKCQEDPIDCNGINEDDI